MGLGLSFRFQGRRVGCLGWEFGGSGKGLGVEFVWGALGGGEVGVRCWPSVGPEAIVSVGPGATGARNHERAVQGLPAWHTLYFFSTQNPEPCTLHPKP